MADITAVSGRSMPTVFVKHKNLPIGNDGPIYGLEICRGLEKAIGGENIDGAQKYNGTWRIQTKNMASRASLLLKGFPLRGCSIQVSSKNTDLIDGRESVKLLISNIPFSVADEEIKKALIKHNIKLGGEIRWECYRDEQKNLTSYKSGRRFVKIAKPETPLLKSVEVARNFTGYLICHEYNNKPELEGQEDTIPNPKVQSTKVNPTVTGPTNIPENLDKNGFQKVLTKKQTRKSSLEDGEIEEDDSDSQVIEGNTLSNEDFSADALSEIEKEIDLSQMKLSRSLFSDVMAELLTKQASQPQDAATDVAKEVSTTDASTHHEVNQESIDSTESTQEEETQTKISVQPTLSLSSTQKPASSKSTKKGHKLMKEDTFQKTLNDFSLRGRPQLSRSSSLSSVDRHARSPTPKRGISPDKKGAAEKKRKGGANSAPTVELKPHNKVNKVISLTPPSGPASNKDINTHL